MALFQELIYGKHNSHTMQSNSKIINTPYDSTTYKIIGCAMALHRKIGPGLRENSYQRDLANYLVESNLSFQAQKLYEVYDSLHKDLLIGYYIPDFIVEDTVVVEIKALRGLDNSHIAQIIGYLAVTGCPVGLLINFGERSLKYQRVLPPKNITDHMVNRQWLFVPGWLKSEDDI